MRSSQCQWGIGMCFHFWIIAPVVKTIVMCYQSHGNQGVPNSQIIATSHHIVCVVLNLSWGNLGCRQVILKHWQISDWRLCWTRAPGTKVDLSDGTVWYIPHHAVINPNKPGKLRVVYDCSAKLNGVSLNNHRMRGPDLTTKLISVLLHLRQFKYAIMADNPGYVSSGENTGSGQKCVTFHVALRRWRHTLPHGSASVWR